MDNNTVERYVCPAVCGQFKTSHGHVQTYVDWNVVAPRHRYDPETNKWELVQPMLSALAIYRLAAVGDHLFAVGYKHKCIEAERYCPTEDKWTKVPSPKQCRARHHGITVTTGSGSVV